MPRRDRADGGNGISGFGGMVGSHLSSIDHKGFDLFLQRTSVTLCPRDFGEAWAEMAEQFQLINVSFCPDSWLLTPESCPLAPGSCPPASLSRIKNHG